MHRDIARGRRRGLPLRAERLESRALLAVNVFPGQVALPSITHGNGVATLQLLSSANLDTSTINASSLVVTASTPSQSVTLTLQGAPKHPDLNGDGIPDLLLRFRRSQLAGLLGASDSSVVVTIDVQGTTTSGGTTSSQTDFGSSTITIFRPGKPVLTHTHTTGQGTGQGQGQSQNQSQTLSHGHGKGHGPAHPMIKLKGDATPAPTGYGPAQILHAYGFDQITGNGAGQTIAIVDAYDDPSIAKDLHTFDQTYGLPDPTFVKVNQSGVQGSYPRTDGGWALEISLDVEWAHAIAPAAKIVLVEAKSNSFSNLLAAVDTAATKEGAQVVSMSWGGSDFAGEAGNDSHFNHAGVVFTASSGDNGSGASYPASSPFVVSVGGTTLPLDASGNPTGPETAWSGSGGGISSNEAEPGYQSSFPIPSTGGKRGVPDVSYDADPNTGFAVYDSTSYQGQKGWFQVGGTSAGAPQWAGLIALADQGRATPLSSNSLTASPVYSAALAPGNFIDIVSGSNGGFTATTGYDLVTGLGSPQAQNLITYLQSH